MEIRCSAAESAGFVSTYDGITSYSAQPAAEFAPVIANGEDSRNRFCPPDGGLYANSEPAVKNAPAAIIIFLIRKSSTIFPKQLYFALYTISLVAAIPCKDL